MVANATDGPGETQRIYIAGKMRGLPHSGFPAFDAAASRLRELGYTVVSPADMDRAVGFDGKPETMPTNFIRIAFPRDIAAIAECDGIALLPGWEQSEGASIEAATARMMGLVRVDPFTGEEEPWN